MAPCWSLCPLYVHYVLLMAVQLSFLPLLHLSYLLAFPRFLSPSLLSLPPPPPQQSRGVDGKLPSKVGEGQSGGWYQMFCCYLRWTGRTVLPYQPSSTSLAEGNDTGDVWPVDSDGCLDRLGPLGLIWTLLSKTFGEIREQWMLFLAFLNIGCKDFRSCCFYVLFHVFFFCFFFTFDTMNM